ncbi:hypothetical protein LXA43DRAFT_893111, partial [Ganoderma leucocontextum]
QILSIMLNNTSNNDKMIRHLGKLLLAFKGAFHYMRCFTHVNQLVARSFVGQFDVQQVNTEDIDALVDDDV